MKVLGAMLILREPVYRTVLSIPRDYNFKLTVSVYSTHWDFDGERAYIPILIDDKQIVVVASEGDERIELEVYSKSRGVEVDQVLKNARYILGIDENLSKFYDSVRSDSLLGIISNKLRGIHMRSVQSLWEGLLIGICQQNAGFQQGWLMVTLLREKLGSKVLIAKYRHEVAFLPTPDDILSKKTYIKEARVGYREKVILRCATVFSKQTPELGELEEIKGIGQYTARIARILALRKYDEFPVDRWFARLIPNAYLNVDEVWPKEKVEEFAERMWGKWRGLAAIFITVVTAADTIGKVLKSLRLRKLDPFPDRPSPLTLWRYSNEWVRKFVNP